MEVRNQVGRSLRANLARVHDVLDSAGSEGITSLGQLADRVCTAGWVEPPSGRDLYHALHARTPASRQKALVSMWVKDANAAPGRDEWL